MYICLKHPPTQTHGAWSWGWMRGWNHLGRNATNQRQKPLAVVYLCLITILFLLITILPSNYLCLPLYVCSPPVLPRCPPLLPLVQEDKVSSGEACRDLRGLLSLPLLRLSPRLSAGLPEILWLPKSTPEASWDSSILDSKYLSVKCRIIIIVWMWMRVPSFCISRLFI